MFTLWNGCASVKHTCALPVLVLKQATPYTISIHHNHLQRGRHQLTACVTSEGALQESEVLGGHLWEGAGAREDSVIMLSRT